MKTSQVIVLLAIVFAGTLGAMIIYANYLADLKWTEGYQQGAATAPTAVTPADLKVTLSNETIGWMKDNITSTGTSTANTTEETLTIENKGDSAATFYLTLENPVSGDDGLPSGLENDYFEIYIQSGAVKEYLFDEGEYTSGTSQVTLNANSVAEYTFGVVIEATSEEDVWTDNATYDCELYLYEPSSGNVKTIDFEVWT